MAEIAEVILPAPRDKHDIDLYNALYMFINQVRATLVGDATIIIGELGVPLIVSNTEPTGTIQSGTIWIQTSEKQAWQYIVDGWVPYAGKS